MLVESADLNVREKVRGRQRDRDRAAAKRRGEGEGAWVPVSYRPL